ncbi:RHS repeat-associated core domain-containing protein [Rhodanobacter umsongensis]|uniref:RHS repeat-associated core domain-containing protein n=1 Tax=Rhodanobacter umsongensis TaxID=633153 RepID=A0ABW0JKP9_9GAMM
MAGDPINTSTGNKFLQEDDYPSGGWLTFRRFYNSAGSVTSTSVGSLWRHSFDRTLQLSNASSTPETPLQPNLAVLFRPDGKQETFTKSSGVWSTDPDISDTLLETDNAQGVATGYTVFIAALRHFETYDASGLLQTVTDETGVGITLTYSTTLTAPAVAPSPGLLLTVTDPKGRQLNFTYDSTGHVHQVTSPDGGTLNYAYDTTGNLLSVQYPDTKTRQYIYNESSLTGGANLPNAMTGVVDEAGVRYENTTYDSAGRATSSSFASGVGTTQITYNSNGTSTVQYPLGHSATMGFTTVNGLIRGSTLDQPCGPQCEQPWKTRTYDANGYPASATDFNNNLNTTQYDTNGLLDQQVVGSGSADQRTTNTTWNTTLRVPLTRTVLDASGHTIAKTAWVYNTIGQPLARCEIDPAIAAAASYTCAATGTVPAGVRRWTYTYCTAVNGTQCPIVGVPLTVKGPRTDLTQTTTYSYYLTSSATGCGTPGSACHQAGDLYRIKDALGHLTTYTSYDAAGRVTRITDANGVNTDMTYTPRGWLATRIEGGATTTFGYDAMGDVTSVKDPSGITTTFTYDAAHRLTDITDAQGNVIHYTLDAAGNKTSEQTRTATGTVVRSLSRSYNALGQITAIVDGLSHTMFNGGYSDSYDGNGNLVHSADALGFQHQLSFDALNRLNSTIANYNGADPATQNTQTAFDHDALDRLDGVADGSGLNTLYTYDGLSNRTELQSPDTGTSSDTYDAAGNRLTHTDAKGIVSTSTYDALNRRRTTSYADTTLNVAYTYDEANTVTGCTSSKPKDRLTRVVESGVTTVFCYDSRGNVIQKQQVTPSQTDTTKYTYTVADRLSTVSAPDHTLTTYAYNSDGLVSSVKVTPSGTTSASPTVVSAITWLPFGPISSYKLGNGQTVTRIYDANYRVTDLTSPALNLHFARDAMGNIIALGNAPSANPATETYSYDPLNRLNGISDAGTALESYTYNPTGDRLSKTAPGLATGAYLYTTGTHQLASVGNAPRANDANGNTTGSVIGGETFGFGYNGRNRLTVAQRNGQTVGTYTYNALGQRIGKVATFPQAVTERYAYNEASQLIGEYGTSNRDYIWLGDIPVAVIDNTINGSVTTSTVNHVTADQLDTPRVVTDGTGAVIWSWAYAGNAFEELQPTSSTGYVLNLRSAGEYYDAETGLNSNGYRTREPNTWRFLQSDPIGLAGGISTYAAVGNNPLSYVDSLGLQEDDIAEISDYERNRLQEAFAPKLMPQPQWVPATEQEQEAAEGTCPVNPKSWSTARRAYWRNEASNNPYKYSQANLDRMWRGLPPLHDELNVQMELHHVIPQRDGGTHDPSNLQPLWPWEHAEVDPYRYYNGPTPSAGK